MRRQAPAPREECRPLPDLTRPADFFRVSAARTASVLSDVAMRDLARHWRGMGVWITVWDREGQTCQVDEEGPAVWTTLWQRAALVRDALSDIARGAVENEDFSTS